MKTCQKIKKIVIIALTLSFIFTQMTGLITPSVSATTLTTLDITGANWELTQGYLSAIDKTSSVEFTGNTAFGNRVTYKSDIDVLAEVSLDIKFTLQTLSPNGFLAITLGIDNNSFNNTAKGVTFILYKKNETAIECGQNLGPWRSFPFSGMNSLKIKREVTGWVLYLKNSIYTSDTLIATVPYSTVPASTFAYNKAKLAIVTSDSANSAVKFEVSNLACFSSLSDVNISGIIALKSHLNGKYVCADNAASDVLTANKDTAEPGQMFYAAKFENNIGLISYSNGKYVSVNDSQSQLLIANSGSLNNVSSYTVIGLGNGQVALISNLNGKYIGVNSSIDTTLAANKNYIGINETFDCVNIDAKNLPRISTHQGSPAFFVSDNGKIFYPSGMNYMKVKDCTINGGTTFNEVPSTFFEGVYDHNLTWKDFNQMKDSGYNLVRIFIPSYGVLSDRSGNTLHGIAQPNSDTNSNNYYNGLYIPYMNNVVDAIRTANAVGIYIEITFDWCPTGPYFDALFQQYSSTVNANSTLIEGQNTIFMKSDSVYVRRDYMMNFTQYIKNSDANLMSTIFSFDFQNEVNIVPTSKPFTLNTDVLMANGQTYNMGNDVARQQAVDDSINFWCTKLAEGLHSVDPNIMSTASVFPFCAVGFSGPNGVRGTGDRYPARPKALLESPGISYVDLHYYPFFGTIDDVLSNIEYASIDKTTKPFFLGEIGSIKGNYANVTDAGTKLNDNKDDFLKKGFRGSLFWYWDESGSVDSGFYSALSNYGEVNTAYSTALTGGWPTAYGQNNTELLFFDEFTIGTNKWSNTSNTSISNGELSVTNNEIIKSNIGSYWQNYRLETDVMIKNSNAGLVFRRQDDNNAYMLQLSAGHMSLLKKVNGNWSTINDKVVSQIPNNKTWFNVIVVVNGSIIETYINGQLVDSTNDATFSSGGIGFRQLGSEVATFDNVTVRTIADYAASLYEPTTLDFDSANWTLSQDYTSAVNKVNAVEFNGVTQTVGRVTYKNDIDVSNEVSFDFQFTQQSMTSGQSWLAFVLGVDNNSFNNNSKGVTFLLYKKNESAIECGQNLGMWKNFVFDGINTITIKKGTTGWQLYCVNTKAPSGIFIAEVPFTVVSQSFFVNNNAKLTICTSDSVHQAIKYQLSKLTAYPSSPDVNFGSYKVFNSSMLNGVQPTKNLSDFLVGITAIDDKRLELKNGSGKTLIQSDFVGTNTSVEVYGLTNLITSYKIVIYGDVDGDGKINVLDLSKLKKHLLKVDLLKDCYLTAGDVLKQGNISIKGLLAVKKHILGIINISQ